MGGTPRAWCKQYKHNKKYTTAGEPYRGPAWRGSFLSPTGVLLMFCFPCFCLHKHHLHAEWITRCGYSMGGGVQDVGTVWAGEYKMWGQYGRGTISHPSADKMSSIGN